MKIAIFGATGNTGLELVKQALERGHQVTALVRNPSALEAFTKNENFKAVKCDILKADEVAPHLDKQDCVLSALGVRGFCLFKVSFYLDSMKSIVEAMRKSNVKRLLCVTSFYSKPDPSYPTFYKVFLRPMIGRQLDSMNEMEDYLTSQCQDIDYTIVRPPRLLDEPLKTDVKETVSVDAYYYPDQSTVNQIPRANVARFMLNTLESNEYIKKGVAVDLPKPVAATADTKAASPESADNQPPASN